MFQKILIIDDEPEFLVKALPAYGYEVETSTNGAAGLKKINEYWNNFKLIILDINMPVMNGWDVLKSVRENDKYDSLPIIVLTGSEGEEHEIIGLRKGADDYICKPVRLPVLLARIDNLLKRFSNTPTAPVLEKILSEKEKEILNFIVQGKTNQEISQILFVKDETIKVHLTSIYKKLGVTNRVQAAVFATKYKLTDN